jgi:putative transposase
MMVGPWQTRTRPCYLGGIAKQNKMKPLQIGGIDDHVHVLLGAPAVLAPAK